MAHAQKKPRIAPPQIREGDADGQVVFERKSDEDRFVKSCHWVYEAAELGISRDVWRDELRALLDHVRTWAEQHRDRVHDCLAAPRDSQIAILVRPCSDTYDFDLAEALNQLDLELAEKFRVCACDVLQVPKNATKFHDSKSGLLIYGEPPEAQGEVASEP